jgi:glycosyltransferase involved in cell wall biosynthesis
LGVKLEKHPIRRKNIRSEIKLGCIGRFQYIKGQDILLRAIENVAATLQGKRIYLYFIGSLLTENIEDRNYMNSIKSTAQKLQKKFSNLKIIFTGFVENIYDYMKDFHFIVVPSRYESFSIATVEAMSCGIPVIVPDCGGINELIDDSSGLKFKPGSSNSLYRKIIRMISNYEEFEPCRIRKRAEKFSIESQVRKHLEVYEECLKKLKS